MMRSTAWSACVAQVLFYRRRFLDRRHANLRATLSELLDLGVIPIINENDTVSTVELEASRGGRRRVFGDNDKLSALVMTHVGADLLVLLSDVDGLYTTIRKRRAHAGNAGAATLVSESNGVTEIMRGFAPRRETACRGRNGDEARSRARIANGGGRPTRSSPTGARPPCWRKSVRPAKKPAGTLFTPGRGRS